MNEDLKQLLEQLDLSEETVTKMQSILEAAIEKAAADKEEEAEKEKEEIVENYEAQIAFLKEKAEEYGSYLKEKANDYGDFLKEKANDYGVHVQETLTEKVKEYADYAVEQFITENKERFVQTEEYERIKGAFENIKEAFEYNGFDVRNDVYTQELQSSLNESIEEHGKIFEDLQNARAEIEGLKRSMIFEKATADLAETQKEKVTELLENVSFDSLSEFEEGVALIVEQAKATTVVSIKEETLVEQASKPQSKTVDSSIARFLQPHLL